MPLSGHRDFEERGERGRAAFAVGQSDLSVAEFDDFGIMAQSSGHVASQDESGFNRIVPIYTGVFDFDHQYALKAPFLGSLRVLVVVPRQKAISL